MPKINVDGNIVREMTAEEAAEHERMNAEAPKPEVSLEERLIALEEMLRKFGLTLKE